MAVRSELLRTYIAAEKLGAGDRLPPERELAQALGVPRTALRRMLADLEARGEIWRHVGRGTFLGSPAQAAGEAETDPQDATPNTYPAEVLEVRLIVEPPAAALAALRAGPADVAALERAVSRGAEAASFEEFESWDANFHRMLLAAARNGLLASLYRSIEAARSDRIWGRLKRASLTSERRKDYEESHAAIAAAIADRDPARAEAEMRRHIKAVQASMGAV
ncbi:FadR/GntR family transcriptional regulator [Faunimonas sp. B44]|uniref:FadR/GntR family transcriptional regulator n=1 Tax=Faunimonas sp. B44 TaxID=3461493 RepID=UPI0040449450